MQKFLSFARFATLRFMSPSGFLWYLLEDLDVLMAGNEGGGISAGMGDIQQLPREGILINIRLPGTSSTNDGLTNSTVLASSMDFTGGNDQMASFALSV
jgi:hypothetical protein